MTNGYGAPIVMCSTCLIAEVTIIQQALAKGIINEAVANRKMKRLPKTPFTHTHWGTHKYKNNYKSG